MCFNSGPSLPLFCQPEAQLGGQHTSLCLATTLPSCMFGGIGFNENVCGLCPERRSKMSKKATFKAWWEIGALANVNGFEAEC